MSKSQFIKLSGLAFIAGSFAFVAMLRGSVASPILSSILLATGMLGLRAGYGESVGRFGKNILLIGVVWMVLTYLGIFTLPQIETFRKFDLSNWELLVFAGPAVLLLALTLFGLTALRHKPMFRFNWLPVLAGIWFPVIYFAILPYLFTNNGTLPDQFPWAVIEIPIEIQFLALCLFGFILITEVLDVEILINRTLVYGTLTASIVGLYVLIVGGLGTLFQMQNNLASIVIAILLIAFLIQPLRRRLQEIVNHFVPVPKAMISEAIHQPLPQFKQEHKVSVMDSPLNTTLRGRWLLSARLAWSTVAILATIIYAAAVPVAFEQLQNGCGLKPCEASSQFTSETTSGEQEQVRVPAELAAWYHTIVEAVLRLLSLGVALLIFLRRSDDWVAYLASIFLVTFFVVFSPSPMLLANVQPLWNWPIALLRAIALASTVGLFYLFPDGHFVPRWTRGLAIALLVFIAILAVARVPFQSGFPLFLIALATGAAVQTYKYQRVSNTLQRQQTKWVVLGITAMVFPMLVFFFFAFLNPALNPLRNTGPVWRQGEIIFALMVTFCVVLPLCFLPLTLAFSILRYRLWDIDIIINRTLVYGALTASVVVFYVLIVGGFGILFQVHNNVPGIVMAILLIAFLIQPLRRRLQAMVDRIVPAPKVMITETIPSPLPQTKQEQKVVVSDSASSTILRGRWLVLARLAWAIVFTVLIAMYALGFLAVHNALSAVCEEEPCTLIRQIRHTDVGDQVISSPGPSIGFADPLRPEQIEVLKTVGLTLDQYGWLGALQLGIPALILLLIAAGLFWRKSDDWMVLFASAMVASFPTHNTPLAFTLMVRQPAWQWVYDLVSILALSCLLIFPLIFPNGQFVPRWTRWMAIYEVAGAVTAMFFRNTIRETSGGILFLGIVFLLPSFFISVYAQLYRYFRAARPGERQQFKWVVVGLVGFFVIQLAVLIPLNALLTYRAVSADPAQALVLTAIPDTLWQLNNLLIAICITISVLRYRLWDIDIIISRTLVYGALTASVVGLYVLIVGGFGILFQTQNNLPGIIMAILGIAFLFQPLRQRLQDIVDRFLPVSQSAFRSEQNKPKLVIPEGQGTADTRLRGRWLLMARVTWVALAILTLTIVVIALPARYDSLMLNRVHYTARHSLEQLGLSIGFYTAYNLALDILRVLVFTVVALVIFWRKSDDWMALFISLTLLFFGPFWISSYYSLTDALIKFHPMWDSAVEFLRALSLGCFVLFFYLFPNGRLLFPWMRVLAVWILTWPFFPTLNPLLWPSAFPFTVLLTLFGLGVWTQTYRYSHLSSPLERQQTKWAIFGLAIAISIPFAAYLPITIVPSLWLPSRAGLAYFLVSDTLGTLSSLLIPLTISNSILRYRLWDIDFLINRTLVYGALTGVVVSAFVLLVGFLSALFQSGGNSIIAIIATGLVALLFNPLRQRLQRGVNHLMYGERDEPYTALSRLGKRLEASLAPEAVLPTVVTTVREVLKLPYVAIYLQQDSHGYKIVAESASPSLRIENGRIRVPGMEREGRCFPLIHQGETLGYIVLGPRAPNEAFSSTDLHLLDDLAPQVGTAVHAVRLTADLQRSRERLVLAREEERRRLRRDLHDDLAPTLASLGLTASTVADLIPNNPETATALVRELQTEIRATVGNIRRLVYDLRPPTLDELGLLAAVRERAAQYSNAPDGFHVTVDAPAELPVLPAAVEVAAYRIVQEALENVWKHSQAQECAIRFAIHNGLEIEITDNGIGLPFNITPGVGLRSMRERAEELGGTCVIERCADGGTRILSHLPIGEYDGTFANPDRG